MPVVAIDGEAGTIARFLVDVDDWAVRHVVVNAGSWLDDREVLLSPSELVGDATSNDLMLSTPREEVRRIAETDPAPMTATARTAPTTRRPAAGAAVAEAPASGLVDSREILGMHIEAVGGAIGHLDDLLVDIDTWQIRYVVVDPSNWWLGKHVLILPEWVERFDWTHHKAYVDVDRDAIKSAPEYDAAYVLTREDERAIFRHYNRPPYWAE